MISIDFKFNLNELWLKSIFDLILMNCSSVNEEDGHGQCVLWTSQANATNVSVSLRWSFNHRLRKLKKTTKKKKFQKTRKQIADGHRYLVTDSRPIELAPRDSEHVPAAVAFTLFEHVSMRLNIVICFLYYKYGDTPLHTSARYGHAGVMRILISANCCVSEQNKVPFHHQYYFLFISFFFFFFISSLYFHSRSFILWKCSILPGCDSKLNCNQSKHIQL